MPRVENLGPNVDAWYRTNNPDGAGSSTHDVCAAHAELLEDAPHAFNQQLVPYHAREPQGEDGWGGDVAHPPYDDDDYRCAVCNHRLHDDED
jgi:hypothetical protein